jgi:hypothetical protein
VKTARNVLFERGRTGRRRRRGARRGRAGQSDVSAERSAGVRTRPYGAKARERVLGLANACKQAFYTPLPAIAMPSQTCQVYIVHSQERNFPLHRLDWNKTKVLNRRLIWRSGPITRLLRKSTRVRSPNCIYWVWLFHNIHNIHYVFIYKNNLKSLYLFSLEWCPGQNKRIAPLSLLHGCRKRRLKA